MTTTTLTVLVVVTALGLAVASLSTRLRTLPLSEPLIALVTGVLVGPFALGWLDVGTLTRNEGPAHEIANVMLAISVMAIALRYPAREAGRLWAPVTLLLVVVMPLMALTGAALGATLGIGAAAAVALGCALCPTDPVLASSVVTGRPAERDLPARTRRLLSLESGANDGLALALVLVALVALGPLSGSEAAIEIVREVAGAIVLGVAAGWAAGWAVSAGEAHGATDPAPVVVFTVVLALGVLAAAELLGVGGVLAVFVAGLALNVRSPGDDRADAVVLDEAINRFLVLPGFVLLGAALPWTQWAEQGPGLALVVLGILALRRLPWLLALAGPLRLRRRDAVFLGWFGPIGVSAIFYLTQLAERVPEEGTRLLAIGSAVVAASTVVHGVSSTPGRRWYARAAQRADDT